MEAVSRKKYALKALCQDNTEENSWRYEGMKNKARKAVSRAMIVTAEKAFTELKNIQMRCLA